MESMFKSLLSNKGASKKSLKLCPICDRKAEGEYCNLHETAYKNIVQMFEKWQSSKGIDWKEYLGRIEVNPNSGSWVLEVCKYLLSREETS
ncbi:MAG: hypothetical protein QG670_224 [Thermoproteota archaeon]|nr:hypothetical protein [Thermoproteota archaeon]